jgi:carbonic anhydrase/acetyltransferase-like protein (isoleucine patch superfamily)
VPAHAGAGAAVLGRAEIGSGLWLGDAAVVRADGHYVRIGDRFRLGARGTVHIAHDLYPTHIGSGVSAGAGSVIHACDVGDGTWIGRGAVVLDGSRVGAGAAIADQAVVFPRSELEGGWLYEGSPAAAVRRLDARELASMHAAWRDEELPVEPSEHAEDILFVAATAVLCGAISAEGGNGIWFGCLLDGGSRGIAIGTNTNVQDNSLIRSVQAPVAIGRNATIGHNVTLTDATVGDESLIGIGAVVAPGTLVEPDVLLAAGAQTLEGQRLESGWLYGGRPARKLRPLDAARRAIIAGTWPRYCEYARAFAAAQGAERE